MKASVGLPLMEHPVTLGGAYRDTLTGFTGRATSVTYFLHGCERVVLEAEVGGDVKAEAFDLPRLADANTGATFSATVPGGDRPTPGRPRVPRR